MKSSLVVPSLFFTCLAAASLPKGDNFGVIRHPGDYYPNNNNNNQNRRLFRIVKRMQDRIKDAETQIAKLKKDVKGGQVAFGAAVGGKENVGPFSTDTTLTFGKVFFNSGSFSSSTGVFTAPCRGVYYFSFTGHSHSSKAMGLRLTRNGEWVTLVYNHAVENGGVAVQTGSSSATLELKKGDRVSLRLLANTWLFDNESRHSVFNGFLLFRL